MASKKTEKKQGTVDPKTIEGSKLLTLLTLSFVYICLLMWIYTTVTTTQTILQGFLYIRISLIVSIVFLAGAIVFFIMRKVKKTDESLRVITGKNTLFTAIFFFVASLLIYHYDIHMVKVMYVVVPLWFVLYMIRNVYVRELFLIAINCVVGAGGLYFLQEVAQTQATISLNGEATSLFITLKNYYPILAVLFVIVCGVWGFLLHRASKQDGYLDKNKRWQVASAKANMTLLYIPLALIALCAIISIFYEAICLYCIYALVVYIVCMLVYYTRKMMRR